ncbi:nucleoside 2-deoxyribosyltransferase [Variovorax sp. RA8]|uniref:nucleoside 2-deoxyribosyltransferase n=1 Tax=Variovorax sp. (strain JCM 16519 / RA8) TaxID=662548 RepID=UPI0013184464|nr:nucleoside 2-deoxyribosyltransferase [Variovorax sp. RA8]VTU14294.1 Nucleoside 2-deoxyribosyltransferase [Variovorax sp. RA8]
MQQPRPPRPRVYLAGPDIFFHDCERIYQDLKAACEHLGLEGVEPSDGGLGADFAGSDDERARRIYEGNIALIRQADGVIANLMDFRGLEPDSGTVFEVGFAVALGKPVVAYGVPAGSYASRVCAAMACTQDARGVMRERDSGVTVEGLGQRLNLMLACSVAIEATAEAALARLAMVVLPADPQLTTPSTSPRSRPTLPRAR